MTIKIKEIVCKRWFLPKKFVAITLYPFIFYHGQPTEAIRHHELVHILQVIRVGWIKFHLLYLWYSIKYGYKNNPFEVEARETVAHHDDIEKMFH